MSFKDVRDLAEHLKLLGFPHVFPLSALATSHGCLAAFHLVAEVLQWLVALLEPGTQLSGGTGSETDRVLLIRSATEFFVTKSAVKLNPRKLYAASAVTAAELQKITRLLIAPAHDGDGNGNGDDNGNGAGDEDEAHGSLSQVDIGDKMDDLRRARELSTDLTSRGAALYDLLSKEMLNKEARLAQANRPMELAAVERALKNAIAAAQLRLQSGRAQMEAARVELNALNSKLQRKRAELERTKQRLEALQKIRPAHMQEFEECERELETLFQQYFLRVHVRDALRAQLEARTKRPTPVASPVLQKPADPSSMPFIPEGLMGEDDEDVDGDDADVEVDDGGQLSDIASMRQRRRGNVDGIEGGGGGRGRGNNNSGDFGLDSEIPDIRDEDLMLRGHDGAQGETSAMSRRPGSATATARIRPMTGRSRVRPNAGSTMGRSKAADSKDNGNDDDDDDSSFGSSDSDLDMGGVIGLSRLRPGGGAGGASNAGAAHAAAMLGNMGSERGGMGEDEFDLNSMEDISISKLTGELPLRPRTAGKPEPHSDEDF